MIKVNLKVPFMGINESKTFYLIGKGFDYVNAVFLSGIPYSDQSTFYNIFSAVPRLSALYTGFTAVKLPTSAYKVNRAENYITFTTPSATLPGFVDVIVQNPAGYGALTKYVVRDTYNPYISGMPEYELYEPYVRPWASGIAVLSADEDAIILIDNSSFIATIADDILEPIQ